MIGLFSDSHGDLDAFDAAFELLRARGARRFLFAGGRYADLDDWLTHRGERLRRGRDPSELDLLPELASLLGLPLPTTVDDTPQVKSRFVRTPEPESLAYGDPQVPRKTVDMMGDTLCCMVYDKNELTKEDLLNGLIFLHGKTHEPKVVQIGPRYFVTPGALGGPTKQQTCALLEKDDHNVRFSAFTLAGEPLIERQLLSIDRKTKLRVK